MAPIQLCQQDPTCLMAAFALYSFMGKIKLGHADTSFNKLLFTGFAAQPPKASPKGKGL
jgi:hypothetical protein